MAACVAILAALVTPHAVAQGATPFSTRHAHFEPTAFSQIPGWRSDNLLASYRGLRQSCNALAHKPAWSGLCAEMATIGADNEAVRLFFERNFSAYRVMSPQWRDEGMVTGYFEPDLQGRRERSGTFRHPIYGPPRDLLLLDSSSLNEGTDRQWFVVGNGRLLAASADEPSARAYVPALAGVQPDSRDQRYRVRIEGDRILPYYTRQEIEQRPLDAPVLAWVDDPLQLYAIQVEGMGRIHMEDGAVLRVGFAEQNGQPALARTLADELAFASAPKTRGLGKNNARLSAQASEPARLNDAALASIIANLDAEPDKTLPAPAPRSQRSTRPAATRKPASREREVEHMVAALEAQRSPDRQSAAAVDDRVESRSEGTAQDGEVAAMVAALSRPEQRGSAGHAEPLPVADEHPAPPTDEVREPMVAATPEDAAASSLPDPSYVFFRGMDDDRPGPVGTLGVPLTPGRSLAVDPRIAPLGSPVFVSTREPGGETPLQRLMFAQDSSIALQGGVRGDLFWGSGDTAGRLAQATNDAAQLWLLLPRGQAQDLVAAGTGATGQGLPNCLVVDPEFCVER